MMGQSYSVYTHFFPPKPTFTTKHIPNLNEKVYIVTGSNTGVGKELARMLYSADARVYIAARSQERADGAIEDIKASSPNSKGHIEFLKLDLGDLSTVRSTVECFLAKENRLHVLFNNAGVQSANADTTTQGHEIHLGVNCVGPHLLTKLLTPTLVETAKLEPAGTVRVVWVSSASADLMGEKNMGIDMTNLDYHEDKDFLYKYGMSKMGNLLQAFEYAKRQYAHGIISVPINPGNLQSELYRDQQSWLAKLAIKLVMYPPILGAHTELFAGFSPTASETNPGTWVAPWGRLYPLRKDLHAAFKAEAEGGNNTCGKFYEWCEERISQFT